MQKRNKLIWLSVLIVILTAALDQYTKYLIDINLQPYDVRPVIDNFFNIVYSTNYGAAFSFLNSSPDWFRKPFFIVVPLAAIILVLFLLKNAVKKAKENLLQIFAFSLIIGGALGNFTSRVLFGSVIDFLQFKITPTYYWPSFNVADVAITVAVGLLFIEMISLEKRKRAAAKKEANKTKKTKKPTKKKVTRKKA